MMWATLRLAPHLHLIRELQENVAKDMGRHHQTLTRCESLQGSWLLSHLFQVGTEPPEATSGTGLLSSVLTPSSLA